MRDITLKPAIQNDKNIFISSFQDKQVYLKEIKNKKLVFEIDSQNESVLVEKMENNGGNQFFNINYQIKNLEGTEDFLNRISYDSSYNYFFNEYEEIGKTFGEQELPELYSIISENDSKKIIEIQSRQFFIDFVRDFDTENSKKENKETFLYIDSKILESEISLRHSFPYYNHIKINTINKNCLFSKILTKNSLLDQMCKVILNDFLFLKGKNERVLTQINSKFAYQSYQNMGIFNGLGDKNSNANLYKFDIEDDFKQFYKKISDSVTNQELYTNISKDKRKSTLNPISLIKLKNEFEKVKDSTILDLLGQKDADVIMYEVQKYRDGVYKSSYFIPAYKNEINFYDTQVLEDAEYQYKIYAFTLIRGLNFLIYNINKKEINSEYEASYFLTPDLYFLRVPWDNTELVEDYPIKLYLKNSPPLAPEISFFSNERNSNSIRINLKKRDGTEILIPQIIDSVDKTTIEKYKKINDPIFFTYKVKYQADDSGTLFEVYRLDTQPEKYLDFSPTAATRIYSGENDSFIDEIFPNKTYYYCARMKDLSDNLSNPTEVWKIRIDTLEGQLPIFTKSVYEFGEVREPKEKSFQKYIMIKPTPNQERLQNTEQYSSAFEYDKLQVGKVFGKKFRVEITSKQTGKKIDVILQIKAPIVNQEVEKFDFGNKIKDILNFDKNNTIKKDDENSVANPDKVLKKTKKKTKEIITKISLNDNEKEAYDPGPIKFPIIPAK